MNMKKVKGKSMKLAYLFGKIAFYCFLIRNQLIYCRIMAHVDSPSLFGDTIASISLLSDCLLKFKEKRPSNNKKLAEVESIDEFAILLKRRTLLILQDESRFMFPHEISKDCIEHYENLTIERSRRVSITLRHIRQN